MAEQRLDVAFKTMDGLTLRGWLFKGPKGGPAIIVNGAFNAPKEIFASSVAEWFGSNGITALVYDARTLGTSDGMPRNDLDPQKMAEDNQDAVTYLQDSGWVDPKRIAIWGFFYSSGIALEAAAFDKRVAAVIAQGLMLEWYLNPPDQPTIIAQAIEDRANRIRGNSPEYVPLLDEKGDHMLHMKYLANMTPEQKHNLPNWVHNSKKHAATFVDKMTIQSFYRHAKWRPLDHLEWLAPTPVMILTPENDEIVPPAFQREIFDNLKSKQKRHEIIKDRGHMNLLSVKLDVLLIPQLEFLKEVMEF
ncbi:hypothetical protein KCU78_g725, partial [Aureobasidium melanogenum]